MQLHFAGGLDTGTRHRLIRKFAPQVVIVIRIVERKELHCVAGVIVLLR